MLDDVVEEFALDAKGASGERNFDFALSADVIKVLFEQSGDMGGIGGRGNGHDSLGLRNLPCRGQDRRAAEAVADQNGGSLPRLAQMVGGAHEIGDVR